MVESAAVIYFYCSRPQRGADQIARPLVITQESTKLKQGSSKWELDKEQPWVLPIESSNHHVHFWFCIDGIEMEVPQQHLDAIWF